MASFTKDKLKAELAKYNVPFPRDAKKDVYVELYKSHIENKDRLEFSSDEETAINASPSKRNKKKPGSPTKKPSKEITSMNGQANIEQYSDDELRKALKSHGVNAGPITDTTRRLYVKKLERLMSEKTQAEPVKPPVVSVNRTETVRTERVTRYVPPPAPPVEEFSDRDDPVPEPEPEPQPRQTVRRRPMPTVRQSPRRPTPVRKPDPPAPVEPEEEEEEEEEEEDIPDSLPPPTKPRISANGPSLTRPPLISTKPAQRPQKQVDTKKRRFPIWLQIFIFLAVAAVVYFVIQNLEPSGKSFIGKITGVGA